MSTHPKKKIFRYIFSLLALLIVIPGVAQQTTYRHSSTKPKAKKTVKKKVEPQPFLRAVTIQADIAGPLISSFSSNGVKYGEASVDLNIRNKWFPVWELGYASINHTADEGGAFKGSGIYNRIGLNVNLMKITDPKTITASVFYVGLRFGFAPFNYDLHNLPLTDDYWKTSAVTNLEGLKASAKWGEIVAGVRLNIFKNISLGWDGRLKLGLSTGKGDYSPWYVPGYGINDGTVWSFTYKIGYTIPIR